MSRDRRGDRTQEVVGSIPISSTICNDVRNNHLALPPSTAKSPVSAQVSNRASNAGREKTVSRRLERTPLHDDE